jgi:hypothetical protein
MLHVVMCSDDEDEMKQWIAWIEQDADQIYEYHVMVSEWMCTCVMCDVMCDASYPHM